MSEFFTVIGSVLVGLVEVRSDLKICYVCITFTVRDKIKLTSNCASIHISPLCLFGSGS